MRMKLAAVAVCITSMAVAANEVTEPNAMLATDKDKLSYSIGVDLGKNIKKQGIDINATAMSKGIDDGMKGGTLLLTDQQMKDVLSNFQKEFMAKRAAEFNQKATDNKTKGEAFLEQNRSKPGVVVLSSGLQYKVITAGKGDKPGKDDTVTVEYTGRLVNGDVFDSTEKSGKPATFKLSQVIPGWTEALQLMPVGSTWEIYVPASLAYGARSVGGVIGPNETLIFNVHLISAKK